MKRLPVWFERTENLAIAAAVVVAFVHLHFAWWWLPVLFLAFDASMAGYFINGRAGAIGYNLVHFYAGPAVLLLCYVLSGGRKPGKPGGIIPPSRCTLARSHGRWPARLPVDRLAVGE